MRLFIGVEMNHAVEAAAGEVLGELRARAGRLAPRARITWVSPERLHVTVQFIGAVDEERCQAIRSALGVSVEAQAFDLTVEGVGAFPPKGPPRVLWAGLTDGTSGLHALERTVSQRLDALVSPEERPYSPHLTLARVRDSAGLQRQPLLDGLVERRFGRVHVDAITLFESRLSPKGPSYVPLQRTALRRRT